MKVITTIERNNLETITNTITAFVSKPVVGITAGLGAGFTSFLTMCGIVSTIFGAIAAVAGATVALLHLYFFLKKIWKLRKVNVDLICSNEKCLCRKSLDEE